MEVTLIFDKKVSYYKRIVHQHSSRSNGEHTRRGHKIHGPDALPAGMLDLVISYPHLVWSHVKSGCSVVPCGGPENFWGAGAPPL